MIGNERKKEKKKIVAKKRNRKEVVSEKIDSLFQTEKIFFLFLSFSLYVEKNFFCEYVCLCIERQMQFKYSLSL